MMVTFLILTALALIAGALTVRVMWIPPGFDDIDRLARHDRRKDAR